MLQSEMTLEGEHMSELIHSIFLGQLHLRSIFDESIMNRILLSLIFIVSNWEPLKYT